MIEIYEGETLIKIDEQFIEYFLEQNIIENIKQINKIAHLTPKTIFLNGFK